MAVSDTHDSTDIVAQAFKELEAGVEDAGFSATVDSRLTFRIRIRRTILSAASLLGLALFLQQLNAGRYLFAELLAPLFNIGSLSHALPGADWLAALVLVFAVTAVLFSTLFTVVLALRVRSTGQGI